MDVTITEAVTAINTLWILVTGFLVFFMQLGFGMLEAGLIRAKNVTNILIKNILDFCTASIFYWAVGFALMYGVGNALFGATFFFLKGIPETTAGVPTVAYWFFQLCFAGATATIVAGGVPNDMIIAQIDRLIPRHFLQGKLFLGELEIDHVGPPLSGRVDVPL